MRRTDNQDQDQDHDRDLEMREGETAAAGDSGKPRVKEPRGQYLFYRNTQDTLNALMEGKHEVRHQQTNNPDSNPNPDT